MFENLDPSMSVSEQEAEELAAACPDGGVILEIGSNVGRGTERIVAALKGAGRVVSIDNNDSYVEQARLRVPEATVICDYSQTYVPDFTPDVILVDGGISTRRSDVARYREMFPQAAIFLHDANLIGYSKRMARV
jgi:ubiquinone/menaquinone biosynthesis C-methylase UbiE